MDKHSMRSSQPSQGQERSGYLRKSQWRSDRQEGTGSRNRDAGSGGRPACNPIGQARALDPGPVECP
jgi:hypothetical protein